MTKQFDGKTAFITGGGTGIGQAAAFALAAEGCLVTICGRSEKTLRETVQQIDTAGGKARFALCDVSDEDSVRAAVEVATRETGRLDFGVNSAGISGGDNPQKTADYATEFFDKVIAIDLRGTFLAMKYELAKMQALGSGSIVNISSAAGLVGAPGFSGYTAAKHGVVGLTKTAALDYGSSGIRVNAICAGLVDTPLVATGRPPEVMATRITAHALGRIAKASEIADAVVWLCSQRSSFVTGTALSVDGGYVAR